jgi:hypothetical protein
VRQGRIEELSDDTQVDVGPAQAAVLRGGPLLAQDDILFERGADVGLFIATAWPFAGQFGEGKLAYPVTFTAAVVVDQERRENRPYRAGIVASPAVAKTGSKSMP